MSEDEPTTRAGYARRYGIPPTPEENERGITASVWIGAVIFIFVFERPVTFSYSPLSLHDVLKYGIPFLCAFILGWRKARNVVGIALGIIIALILIPSLIYAWTHNGRPPFVSP
jgi:hypothetical protein